VKAKEIENYVFVFNFQSSKLISKSINEIEKLKNSRNLGPLNKSLRCDHRNKNVPNGCYMLIARELMCVALVWGQDWAINRGKRCASARAIKIMGSHVNRNFPHVSDESIKRLIL
jgi:hypothetical protein